MSFIDTRTNLPCNIDRTQTDEKMTHDQHLTLEHG